MSCPTLVNTPRALMVGAVAGLTADGCANVYVTKSITTPVITVGGAIAALNGSTAIQFSQNGILSLTATTLNGAINATTINWNSANAAQTGTPAPTITRLYYTATPASLAENGTVLFDLPSGFNDTNVVSMSGTISIPSATKTIPLNFYGIVTSAAGDGLVETYASTLDESSTITLVASGNFVTQTNPVINLWVDVV